jgi:hypothetical protein
MLLSVHELSISGVNYLKIRIYIEEQVIKFHRIAISKKVLKFNSKKNLFKVFPFVVACTYLSISGVNC